MQQWDAFRSLEPAAEAPLHLPYEKGIGFALTPVLLDIRIQRRWSGDDAECQVAAVRAAKVTFQS